MSAFSVADVLGAASVVSGLTGSLIPPKKSLRTRQLSPNCFFEVWDVSILSRHGSVSRATALSRISLRNESEWASATAKLPEHEPETIRIYISEVSDTHHSLLDKSASRTKPASTDLEGAAKTFSVPLHQRWESESIQSTSSIHALISQWNSSSHLAWYDSLGWYFLKSANDRDGLGLMREIRGFMDDVGDIMGRTHQKWAHLFRSIRLAEENGMLQGKPIWPTHFQKARQVADQSQSSSHAGRSTTHECPIVSSRPASLQAISRQPS